jgi:hypothetical protein
MPAAEIEGTPAPIGRIARTYGRLKLLRAPAISAAAVICAARTMAFLPGEIRTYRALVDALRARRLDLDISFALLDELAGLATGYSTKVLSSVESRSKHPKLLGSMSLAVILGALGVKLVLVEDPAAMEQIKPRLIPRHRHGSPRHAVIHVRQPRPAAPIEEHAA